MVETQTPSLRVVDEFQSPPTGWHCLVSETQARFSGPVFADLVSSVAAHLLANGLDPAAASARVHESTARVLIAKGHRELVERVAEKITRSPVQFAQGAAARVLLWWKESPVHGILSGKFERGESPFVDQEEADRRAKICAGVDGNGCPKNRLPTGKGWAQNWTDRKMLDCVDGRKTASHADLGVCKACGGCELRAAVWWPTDILRAVTPKADAAKYPDHCWKRALLA